MKKNNLQILSIIIFFLIVSIKAQTGIVKSYYISGELHSEESWVNSILDGTSFFYFENGNLKTEKTYSKGVLNGWLRLYYESGLLKEEFYIENGVRDGVDKIYFSNGALQEIRFYKKGILDKNIELKFDPNFVAPSEAYVGNVQQKINEKKNEIICDAEICPVPIGGLEAIERKIKYPEHAKLYGLEGRVLVMATVDTLGNVIKTEVLHGLGLGLDEEAKRVVEATKFFPAENNGQKVIAEATMPINFSLKKREIILAQNKISVDYFPLMEKGIDENENRIDLTKDLSEIPLVQTTSTEEIQNETTISHNVTERTKETINTKPEEVAIVTKKEESKKVEKPIVNKQPIPIIEKEKEINQLAFITCDSGICAEPIGGYKKLLKNFKIPKRVKEKGIKGKIIIQALIDKYGSVKETEIIEGLPDGANDAAEVAVLYTKFKAAKLNGVPVSSKVRILFEVK